MQILGIANSYASAPVTAPTGLSATVTTTTATVSFTAPTNDGGTAITNYEYSFNNSTWTALSPADAASPVTISGLTSSTAYTIYLRAVNIVGSGPASTGLGITTATNAPATLEYLVIAGGSNGHPDGELGGGGGAGGYRTNVVGQLSGRGAAAESAFSVALGTAYTVTVGGATSNSVFASITSLAGGIPYSGTGGSGGGGRWDLAGGAGTAGQGGDGRTGNFVYQSFAHGGGGGGAGSAGGGVSPHGVDGQTSNITGTAVTRAGGGGAGTLFVGGSSGGAGGGGAGGERTSGTPGAVNTGGGGGSGGTMPGGSGIVIIRYADSFDNITNIGVGLTYSLSTTGGYKIYSFTAGTGVISF
jgi:hypothetical protein